MRQLLDSGTWEKVCGKGSDSSNRYLLLLTTEESRGIGNVLAGNCDVFFVRQSALTYLESIAPCSWTMWNGIPLSLFLDLYARDPTMRHCPDFSYTRTSRSDGRQLADA